MAYVSRKALRGSCPEHNPPPLTPRVTEQDIVLSGSCMGQHCELVFDEKRMLRHTLLLGSPRSGKTNTITNILSQKLSSLREDDRVIVFDPRGDYLKLFDPGRGDKLISPLARHRDVTSRWSLFGEADALSGDEERDTLFREISMTLMGDNHDSNNQFFYDAAGQLLNGVLHNIYKLHGKCHNGYIREAVCGSTLNNKRPELIFADDPRFAFLDIYVTGGSDAMARSVLGFTYRIVDNYFSGFWSLPGDFALGTFVRRKNTDGCKVLFIEYDAANGRSMDAIFSLIIDLALKNALANEQKAGRTYFCMDEVSLLNLDYLKPAAAFGAGQGLTLIAAAQNVSQFYDQYDKPAGDDIISCFGNMLSFKNNDGATRELLHERFGEAVIESMSSNGYTVHRETETCPVVDDTVINSLGVGQAVFGLASVNTEPDPPPFIFTLDYFKQN